MRHFDKNEHFPAYLFLSAMPPQASHAGCLLLENDKPAIMPPQVSFIFCSFYADIDTQGRSLFLSELSRPICFEKRGQWTHTGTALLGER